MSHQNNAANQIFLDIVLALLAATGFFTKDASADFSIDLIWTDTETPTLDLTDPGAYPGVSNCHPNAGPQAGYCLQVRLTTTEPFVAVMATIAWNEASSGIASVLFPSKSFAPGALGADVYAISPGFQPTNPQMSGCAPACDTAVGSFGGLTLGVVPAGTYIIGSITFDLQNRIVGTHRILNFQRPNVDGILDENVTQVPVAVEDATLLIQIPEPGTASLLGLGIVGLVLGAMRRD